MMRVIRQTGILALASVFAGGCSFMFVDKPSTGWQRRPFPPDCTSSVAPPVIDTVLALSNWLGYAGTPDTSTDAATGDTTSNKDLKYGLIAFGALYSVSAIYGYQETSECRRAKAEKEAEFDEGSDEGQSRKKKRRHRDDDEQSSSFSPWLPSNLLLPPLAATPLRAAWLPAAPTRSL